MLRNTQAGGSYTHSESGKAYSGKFVRQVVQPPGRGPPAQQITGFSYGNGVTATFGYSAQRLQMTSLKYAKGATKLLDLTYSYTQGGGNNGQMTKITDLVDNGRARRITPTTLWGVSRRQ